MTTQRTFEPHEFAPYAEANNICRHCDRGRYALHHEQPRPEQAGRLAALDTWCECGHAKYNHGEDDFSSQDCHVKDCDCDSFTLAVEHDDAPAAPKRGDVLESQEFYELMQAYRHAGIADQDQVVAAFEAVKTYVHEQHSTLIAQRDQLTRILLAACSTLKSYQYGNVSPELAKEMISTIERVLTTSEQEGTEGR